MKKFSLIALALVIALAVAFVSCKQEPEPPDPLNGVWALGGDINSKVYTLYDGSFTFSNQGEDIRKGTYEGKYGDTNSGVPTPPTRARAVGTLTLTTTNSATVFLGEIPEGLVSEEFKAKWNKRWLTRAQVPELAEDMEEFFGGQGLFEGLTIEEYLIVELFPSETFTIDGDRLVSPYYEDYYEKQ